MTYQRTNVAGVEFDALTMGEAVATISAMAGKRDKPRYVCTGNLDHLAMLERDADFRAVYQGADLVLADGMPVVWLSKLFAKRPLRERVAGSDLFWEIIRVSGDRELRIFLLGGSPGSAEAAAEAARARYPDAQLCGTYCPPFDTFESDVEQDQIRRAISAADPSVLLVAFGSPKQEKWIAEKRELLGVPVSIGVGASFEMAAGKVQRAPNWLGRCGLEWLYRLAQEPRRLWSRYIGRDLPYLAVLVLRSLRSSDFLRRKRQASE